MINKVAASYSKAFPFCTVPRTVLIIRPTIIIKVFRPYSSGINKVPRLQRERCMSFVVSRCTLVMLLSLYSSRDYKATSRGFDSYSQQQCVSPIVRMCFQIPSYWTSTFGNYFFKHRHAQLNFLSFEFVSIELSLQIVQLQNSIFLVREKNSFLSIINSGNIFRVPLQKTMVDNSRRFFQ